MVTIKMDNAELLKQLAKSENRSQGQQVDFLVKERAKQIGIIK